MGHYVDGRWVQDRGPYGTQHLRDRRDIERQQWEGRGGTGKTDRWRYHLRERRVSWENQEHDSYFATEPEQQTP